MKIMTSSLTYPLVNGVTVSINTTAEGFLKKGHDIRIVAPDYKKGKVRPEHVRIPSSLLIHKMAVNLLGREERVFRANSEKRIAEAAREFNPDAYFLHSVTWAPNAFESHMLKSDKPTVLFYHTLVEEYGRIYAGKAGAYVMRRRTKSLANKVNAVMTPSAMMKDKLIEYGVKTPIYVIPTGIEMPEKSFTKKELRKKFNLPEKTKILLYLGRISKEKNLGVLLDMMEEIRRRNYRATLLFIGPGDTDEIKKRAEKLGVRENIVCTGPLKKEEAQKVYGACDVFVFASQTETQGLAVGEAMLAGLPVVALKSPIQKEVYPKGKAVIVEKKENFAKAVIGLFEDEERREEIVKEGKKYVRENFNKEKMIKKQIKVFKRLVEKE